ncbi:MAG TPA: ATP-binding protein [Xanthomonadales bacterium]|nr:ATP-binding protein [Xanthomonadales bacterium]
MQEAAISLKRGSTLIGHVVETTAAYFRARMVSDEDGFSETITIGEETFHPGRVGSYLMVRQSGNEILVMLESIWEDIDADGETVYMTQLAPMGEFYGEDSFDRGVRNYPTTGAEVHVASERRLAAVFGGYSIGGFKVGTLSTSKGTNVYLDAGAFYGRHAAILGQTGSGKSWTVTSFIQSTLKSMPNTHIVLMDLHGEYSHKHDDSTVISPFPMSKVRCIQARDLELPFWMLTFEEQVELFIDDEDADASIQSAFMRATMLDLKREANSHLDLGNITVDSPVYYDIEEMMERFKEANERTADFGKTKEALYGRFDHMLIRMNSMISDTRYDFLLRPKKRTSTETLPDLMRDFIGLGQRKAAITVLDLSAVPFDVTPMVTALVGRMAFEFNYWNPRCTEFPIYLICEEAHQYIPREDSRKFRRSRRAIEFIAKNGRKYGVGLAVVTQRPHDLSETVLSQCGTFICMRIANPDDQEYVRAMVPDASRGTFAALTSLARGEAIAMGEAVPMPVRFQVTMPEPPPNSPSIDYATYWQEEDIEIDVDDLVRRWHRQER